jgi:catechol 2,3-dioxygenase-like lactoylglutathione lyase family enzyme
MNLKCQHIVIRTSNISEAKDFYVNKLGMEVLEEAKNFFASKAGDVRFSFFEGYEKQKTGEDTKTGVSVILRVDDLDDAIKEAKSKEIKLNGEVIDIPNFHKFQEIEDPDGNILFLAEYKVEPV